MGPAGVMGVGDSQCHLLRHMKGMLEEPRRVVISISAPGVSFITAAISPSVLWKMESALAVWSDPLKSTVVHVYGS